MDSNALDRHITGNWGEDSVGEDFIPARELPYRGAALRIDVASEKDPEEIVATIRTAVDKGDYISVDAEEFQYVFVIPADAQVRLASD